MEGGGTGIRMEVATSLYTELDDWKQSLSAPIWKQSLSAADKLWV
jgi:hypothetical protein